MTDTQLRELCHQFFDAIERADLATIASLYAPGMQLWVNVTGKEITGDENLAVLEDGAKLHRRRTYDDRIVNTFDTGVVVQYSVNVVAHTGKRTSLSACVIAQCRDGKITRLDEYLDAGKFGPRVNARNVAEGASA